MDKKSSLFIRLLEFVKFSHTVFALPFAFASGALAVSYFVGQNPFTGPWGFWSWLGVKFVGILLCMVFARTAAMGFNRVADWSIDRKNPRTERRHTLVTKKQGITLVLVSAVLFVASSGILNVLCLILSPVALGIVFFYSLTKRFTSYSHFFLGLALAVAPVGAWVAVTGDLFAWQPFILALAVLFWVAGFDMIYATQDYDFDRKTGLNSLVVKWGIPKALSISRWLHFIMWVFLLLFGLISGLHMPYWIGLAVIAVLLVYQHARARKLDTRAINDAFLKANGWISVIVFITILWDVIVWRK
ncbi:MAG: UbiA-like polyprenyltransferase [Verrucomicrobiota bacterium]|nr:UbiA-like polyprenyltransferase [Verrucomicrobiota bacterium]